MTHTGTQDPMLIYEDALKNNEKLLLRFVKFVFIGPPGSGKTTMRWRLVKEIINLREVTGVIPSTGVAESEQIIIKRVVNEPALIFPRTGMQSKWCTLRSKFEHRGDSKLESRSETYLAKLFYHLIIKESEDEDLLEATGTSIATDTDVPGEIFTMNASDDSETDRTGGVSISHTVSYSSESSVFTLNEQLQSELLDNIASRKPGSLNKVTTLPADTEIQEVQVVIKKLYEIITSDNPEKLRLLEELILVSMIDIGGQPAFLDMLPIITSGSALYLIFFQLNKELTRHYPVVYRSPAGSRNIKLDCSYCAEDVILRALSSIACSTCNSLEKETSSSAALLFGTYKDKVCDVCLKEAHKNIETMIKSTAFQNQILCRTKEGYHFFPVDNMEGTESEIMNIQEDIEGIVTARFRPIPIPAPWLMFGVLLPLLNKPVVSIIQCTEVAEQVKMTDSVTKALRFFHDYVGNLMYYPEIPSMDSVVICNPQTIFDHISELIISTFTYSNRDIPQEAIENFQKKGQFTTKHIKTVMKQPNRKHQLSLNQFIDLLIHLNILAPISSKNALHIQSTGDREYIIPAVLPNAENEVLEPEQLPSVENRDSVACSLMIYFDNGFVPLGVFCATVAHLVTHQHMFKPSWKLCDEVYKNKFSFLIDHAYCATLISRPKYLEIYLCRLENTESELALAFVCDCVRETVVSTLEEVIKTKLTQPFKLGFHCLCKSDSTIHPMLVQDENPQLEQLQPPVNAYCLLKETRYKLKHHLIWFGKVYMCDQLIEGQVTENDIRYLLTELNEFAAKWKEIGIQLGFRPGELKNIEANPNHSSTAPGSWLCAMLSAWVQWYPNDHRRSEKLATIDALKAAVSKTGLERLAARLHIPSRRAT